MIDSVLAHAAARPASPALIDGSVALCYGELAERARAGAAQLLALGVRPGDTVALALGEAATAGEEVCRLYALQWLGAAILPLYPEQPPARRDEIAAAFAARRVDFASVDGRLAHAGAADAARNTDPQRPLYYEYSSGTTGAPKMVLYTVAARTAALRAQIALYGWGPGDRLVAPLRWATKVGLRNLTRIHVAGGALINEPFPDTRALLALLVQAFGMTCLCSTPWQLRRLLASKPGGAERTPLRFLDTNGAPIEAHEARQARETLTPQFHVNYGCSEAGMIAHLAPTQPFDAAPRLVPGIEGQAVDQAHRALPPGERGSLRFRAPWFPRAYAGNAAASAEHFRDGWFYPGDAGSVTPDGGVRLAGRDDDTINYGGYKLLPREVEQVLLRFPGITEAVVLGAPHPMAGEQPVGFVVAAGDIDAEALVQHCHGSLPLAVIPDEIITLRWMPRSPEGKLQREELLRIYREYKARG